MNESLATEGCNTKIKMLTRTSCGLRNVEVCRVKMLPAFFPSTKDSGSVKIANHASPFIKGGFRGIINFQAQNPPCPLYKRGDILVVASS